MLSAAKLTLTPLNSVTQYNKVLSNIRQTIEFDTYTIEDKVSICIMRTE